MLHLIHPYYLSLVQVYIIVSVETTHMLEGDETRFTHGFCSEIHKLDKVKIELRPHVLFQASVLTKTAWKARV